jgi:hypothetical protein
MRTTTFRIVLSAALVSILFLTTEVTVAQTDNSESHDFGFGLMLGEPTGFTVKSWLGANSAFDIGAAWSLSGREEAVHLHANYLYHSWFQDTPNLAFYSGIGGRIIFSEDATAGVRIPLGLTYLFDAAPFDIFVEAVPILDLSPDIEFAGNGAVGLRYYF